MRRRRKTKRISTQKMMAATAAGFVIFTSSIVGVHALMNEPATEARADIMQSSISLQTGKTKRTSEQLASRSTKTSDLLATGTVTLAPPKASSTETENKAPKVVNTATSASDTTDKEKTEAATKDTEEKTAKAETAESKAAKLIGYGKSIANWKAKNSDVKGWLSVGGTNINYPVVYHPSDSNYYTSLGYDKNYSKNGVIWAGANTSFGARDNLSPNTVLYGHNWTNYSANPKIGDANDVMFGQLTAFHHLDFAKNNQFIQYATEDQNMVFQVFAAFYTEIDFAYNTPNPDAAGLVSIANEAKDRSLHDYAVSVGENDKIITLSTCTRAFGPSNRQRFVLMAKQVPAGTEPAAVTANNDYRKPSL